MRNFHAWISLFASSSTLVCCALPSLLVSLGMGASMAGLIGTFPQIVFLSKYKGYVFLLSALLLLIAASLNYANRNKPCPIDPKKAAACIQGRKWSKRILIFSFIVWLTGAFFAFLAPLIF